MVRNVFMRMVPAHAVSQHWKHSADAERTLSTAILLLYLFLAVPGLFCLDLLLLILMDPLWSAFWDVEKGMSMKEAARTHGVCYATLRARRMNPVPRKIGGQTQFFDWQTRFGLTVLSQNSCRFNFQLVFAFFGFWFMPFRETMVNWRISGKKMVRGENRTNVTLLQTRIMNIMFFLFGYLLLN